MKASSKLINSFFFFCGFFLLYYLCYKIGWKTILSNITIFNYSFIPLFIVCLFWHLIYTVGWYFTGRLRFSKIPLLKLFSYKMAGEALSAFLPAGSAGSIPVKGYKLYSKIENSEIGETLLEDYFFQLFSGILYIIISLFFLLAAENLQFFIKITAIITLLIFFFFLFLLFFLKKRGFFVKFYNLLKLFRINLPQKIKEKLTDLDINLQKITERSTKNFIFLICLYLLARFFAGIEFYLIFLLLDSPVSFINSLIMGGLTIVINLLFFFVPSGMGVTEGGQLLIFNLLSIDPLTGLTMAIIRRLRRIFEIFAGVIFFYVK